MTMILSTSSPSSSLSGMALAAVSFALLTSVDTIFKLIATGHPAYQILVINGCFALMPILAWTALTGGLGRLKTTRPLRHLMRGSISVVSAFAAIYAYSRLPLTDFYAIVFVGPLLVTALSALWLHETIDRARWIAVLIGFSGILIVANPFHAAVAAEGMVDNGAMMLGRLAAFISVSCYALSVIMIRQMRAGESNLTFSLYGYIASISISALLWSLNTAPAAMEFADVMHLGLSGLLAGISSICLMTAYHRTPASLVAPFQYTQIIWGAVAGYLLWAHVPDTNLVMGATIVAASGMFVIYSEMRIKDTIELGRLADSDDGV